MPAAKKKAATKAALDVRKPSDIKALLDLVEKRDLTIILIHADYCGHCHRYRDAVWKDLESMPSKRNGLASIHYDQVENTPFSGAKIQGYPSVILVGKDKVPAEFKEEGSEEVTNALPMEEANNKEKMMELVTSEPSTLMGSLKGLNKGINITASAAESLPEESMPLDEEAENLRNETINAVRKSLERPPSARVSVPDAAKDVLDSQKAEEEIEFSDITAPTAGKGAAVGGGGGGGGSGGGNLYSSLLAATRIAAPAAVLTGVALMKGKRRAARKSNKRSRAKKGRRTLRAKN